MNWGRTHYALKAHSDKHVIVEINYNFSTPYHTFEIKDLHSGTVIKNRLPVWRKQYNCWNLNFRKKDYRTSTKNFQMADEKGVAIIEMGKLEDGYYRLEHVPDIDRMHLFVLAITRFQI